MEAHEANMETGEVGKALVEVGGEAFDTGGDKAAAGDSIYLPPKGKVTFKVTAKKGTTLNFICAVHPWMIGTIKVK
jgi:plastocyanin